ncbi:hypothetical protein TNCV_2381411 [Trichonephila clavipes]|nr:hypothetical protein TNCV_2381411 [Trichonephila clavipes]
MAPRKPETSNQTEASINVPPLLNQVQNSNQAFNSNPTPNLNLNTTQNASVFRPCQRISPWWSTCSGRTVHCQHTGGWHRAQGDLYHGGSPNLLTTDKKDRRANRYINERLSLKATCPDLYLSNT